MELKTDLDPTAIPNPYPFLSQESDPDQPQTVPQPCLSVLYDDILGNLSDQLNRWIYRDNNQNRETTLNLMETVV